MSPRAVADVGPAVCALAAAIGLVAPEPFDAWDESLTVREWWRRLVDAGYAYPTWPAGIGGSGASASDARLILGVLARNRVVAPPTGQVAATLAAPTLLAHGTPDQIMDLVRPIALLHHCQQGLG